MQKYNNIVGKFQFFTTLLLVFSIPFFMRFQIYATALWILVAALNFRNIIPNLKQIIQISKLNKILFASLFIYIVSIFYGALISKNQKLAWDLSGTMLLVLFSPIIFASYNKKSKPPLILILKTFVIANIIVLIYLFTHAYFYNIEHIPYFEYATYQNLSYMIHSSYMSINVVFALGIVFYYKFLSKEKDKLFSNIFFVISSIIFLVFAIYMISAKAGLISLGLIIVLFFLSLIFKNKDKQKLKIILFLVVLGLSIFVISKNERIAYRIKTIKYYVKADGKSNAPARVLIWKEAIKIIKKNPVLGTGIADVRKKISDNLSEDLLKGKEYNAHNQFLEVWAGMGILGFISFVSLILTFFIKTIVTRNFLGLIFIVIETFNMLVESILVRFFGIIFFTFFMFLFVFSEIKDNKKHSSIN